MEYRGAHMKVEGEPRRSEAFLQFRDKIYEIYNNIILQINEHPGKVEKNLEIAKNRTERLQKIIQGREALKHVLGETELLSISPEEKKNLQRYINECDLGLAQYEISLQTL